MTKDKEHGFIYNHRIDIIVIASLLLFSILFLLFSDITKEEGSYLEITLDGEIINTYPLSVDGTYSLNGGTNILTVENGKAYMSYSSCPDHICENTRNVRYVGQTIICLPNRLTVTVVGNSDDYVDFVS